MVALRAWLGTHERGDTFFRGRCSRVVFICEALLELILGTSTLCLSFLPLLLLLLLLLHELRRGTHECGNLLFRGRCSRVAVSYTHLTLPTTPYV